MPRYRLLLGVTFEGETFHRRLVLRAASGRAATEVARYVAEEAIPRDLLRASPPRPDGRPRAGRTSFTLDRIQE